MNESALRTLVLYAQYTDKLSYFDDWLDAFCLSQELDTVSANICDAATHAKLAGTIRDYDLIVLLHSTNGDTLEFINPYKEFLKGRKGRLLSFVGNELNMPTVSMRGRIDFLRDIEADFIGTQIPLEAGKWLYEECATAQVIALPHALNPDIFRPVVPQAHRTIDIGVRTNKYLPYLGDNERNELLEFFSSFKFVPPLSVDIDTSKRFTRSEWAAYLNNCKGTISNEAGSYYLERDDLTVNAIQSYLLTRERNSGNMVVKNGSVAHRLWCLLPFALRQRLKTVLCSERLKTESDVTSQCDFTEIYDLFFKNKPRPPYYSKAISSRHFDAIGTKTCQILLKGRYNDILEENVHYLALNHDFSNIGEVMEKFNDHAYRTKITDTAYCYAMDSHTYMHRIALVRSLL